MSEKYPKLEVTYKLPNSDKPFVVEMIMYATRDSQDGRTQEKMESFAETTAEMWLINNTQIKIKIIENEKNNNPTIHNNEASKS